MRYDHLELCLLPDNQLATLFDLGTIPTFEELGGWEFDGYNTFDGTHFLGIRRFRKGFMASDETVDEGEIGGYNVTVNPGPPTDRWDIVYKQGKPHRHSPYRVYPVRPWEKDAAHLNALLINYDCKRNPFWNPGVLRDYLVKIYPDNNDLYLGKAYVALGPARLYISYFILRRAEQVDPATVWA
jgi:hypothetical protein